MNQHMQSRPALPFVGREDEMDAAFTTLRRLAEAANTDGIVWDFVGIWGIGKSTLLKRVRKEAGSSFGNDLIQLPENLIGQPVQGVGAPGDCGPGASAQALLATLERSCKILRSCADFFRANGHPFGFHELVMKFDIYLRDAHRMMDQRRTSADRSPINPTEEADRAELRRLQGELDEMFVRGWDEVVTTPVLITLDEFEKLAEDQLGHWILAICPRLARTLTLLARVPSGTVNLPDQNGLLVTKNLPFFTPDHTRAYLTQRFDPIEIHPQLATIAQNYTEGHPGGLYLVANLITEKDSRISPEELHKLLDRPQEDMNLRWADLIEKIVYQAQDPVLRDAVNVVSVTRWFDAALLECLLEAGRKDDVEAVDAAVAIRRLRSFGLIQQVEGLLSGTNRLVEFIRNSLATTMYTTSLPRWQQLHRVAANHYMELLDKEEDTLAGGDYGQWYRYERATWQANKLQWLYHSGQALVTL